MAEDEGWVIAQTRDHRGKAVFRPFRDTFRGTRRDAWKAFIAPSPYEQNHLARMKREGTRAVKVRIVPVED